MSKTGSNTLEIITENIPHGILSRISKLARRSKQEMFSLAAGRAASHLQVPKLFSATGETLAPPRLCSSQASLQSPLRSDLAVQTEEGGRHSPVETLAEVGGLRACSFRATTLTVYSSPGFSPVWLKEVTLLGSWAITPPSLFCGWGRGKQRKREKITGRERRPHCLRTVI